MGLGLRRGFIFKAGVCVALATLTLACGETRDSREDEAGDGGKDGGSSTDGGEDSKYLVETITQRAADKLDLLFMIDNSISMADKQAVLRTAVPDLVRRLVSPNCVDESGRVAEGTPADPSARCASGYEREFTPLKDIHIGVITSSLGGHGADDCKGADGSGNLRDEESDDHGHLIAKRPRFAAELAGVTGPSQPPEAQGFLNWNPGQLGSQNIAAFVATFQAMVTAADEFGCGYEAQLEAVYHFLADPNPYKTIETAACPGAAGSSNPCAYPTGVDQDLLSQRAAFLRPDSVVVATMITDENDCSIIDSKQSYYAARSDIFLPKATAECAANPNDPCCRSCVQITPDGCQEDPTCADNGGITRKELDQANHRCLDQKRRFGIDFLYPTDRYVNALKERRLCTSVNDLALPGNPETCPDANGDGQPDLYDNPLYKDLSGSGKLPRDPAQVFFAGILGVPWQDLRASQPDDPARAAYPESELHYQTAGQLVANGTWDKILGTPHPGEGLAPIPPTNTLMLESVAPRGGTDGQSNPLAPPSGSRLQNPVNGHEWGNVGLDDLQYACIFQLEEPRDCEAVKALPNPRPGCDCASPLFPGDNNPLCQAPDGSYGSNQYFAKAYPGLRELQVLKDFGENAIVSSICARNLRDQTAQDYGYRPAVDAIVDRLGGAFKGRCLPRRLTVDDSGSTGCNVIEVVPGGAGDCDASRSRVKVPEDMMEGAKARMEAQGSCGVPGMPSCDDFTYCVLQEAGESCHQTVDVEGPGWCYIDPIQNPKDNPALVARCPANERRIIRFVGEDTPAAGAQTLIVCGNE